MSQGDISGTAKDDVDEDPVGHSSMGSFFRKASRRRCFAIAERAPLRLTGVCLTVSDRSTRGGVAVTLVQVVVVPSPVQVPVSVSVA